MQVIKNLMYGEHSRNRMDLYLPENDSFDLFMYIHGGGLEGGGKEGNVEQIFEYLAKNGIASAAIEYRLYPEAHYPDFIEDSAQAAAWLKKNISNYGNCNRIFLGGSSAGGYLSMMLCFDKRWLGAHGLTANDFGGFVHDAGQPTKHFNVLRELGIDTRRVIVDDTAPIYHIGEDESYPPMFFIVSDNDIQNRYEQTILTLSTLKHFGYDQSKIKFEVKHGGHCHYVGMVDQNGNSVLGQMVYEFMKNY